MKIEQPKLQDYWPLFFLITSLEAAVALIFLFRIPYEGEGLSAMRWIMVLLLAGIALLSALAAYVIWRDRRFRNRWLDPCFRPRAYAFLTPAFPVLAAGTGIASYLLRWWDPGRLLPFFERAWPLLGFVIVFCIQATVWLFGLRFGVHRAGFESRKPALMAWIILLLVFGFVSLTGLGLTPDPAYWGEPGVPLQGWQLGLALILAVFLFCVSLLPFFMANPGRTDLLTGILVWALAAGVWLSVPNEVLKNSFYFPIDPPANMPLPYSDSAYYDYMAHGLLSGVDYVEPVPTRPLYILFLAGLHLLFGENYNLIIVGQTLVLAAFPVVLYALGKKLHSRLAGLTVALLAIFREWTNLLVSSDTRVSNTKMLLVDIPTLLLILLACLFALGWLERKEWRNAFLAGGVFGVLLLLRTQSMLILPVVFVVAFLVLHSERRPWLRPILIFISGLIISTAPWLTHNYLRIGKFSFDAPFQYQVLASQYAYTGNLDFRAVDLENKSVGQLLVTFALKDPGFVAGFISNHFLATETGSLLALPLIESFNGIQAPVNLYWTSFDGSLAWYNSLLVIAYLALIAVGIGASWRRWRWAGLLPLAFNLGYAAANGIGRFSGWRYDLPADWVAYFYFGIGFAEIFFWFGRIFGFQLPFAVVKEKTGLPNAGQNFAVQILPYAAAFALLGALPWIAEGINPPPRYPSLDAAILQSKISKEAAIPISQIQGFADQPRAVTLQGTLLYPRTFSANSGLTSATPWPSYAPRDFPRLGFRLLNRDVRDVVFPNKGVPVKNVHGMAVLLLGCQLEGYVEARLLVFPSASLTYLSDRGFQACLP